MSLKTLSKIKSRNDAMLFLSAFSGVLVKTMDENHKMQMQYSYENASVTAL